MLNFCNQKLIFADPNKKGLSCDGGFRPTTWRQTSPGTTFDIYLAVSQTQHLGTGPPPFNLVLIGAAAAKQVQATATTRTKVLTARVIGFLPTCGFPGSGNPSGRIIPMLSSTQR
jgi:hypothetical protein